jgi:hypothetical protein
MVQPTVSLDAVPVSAEVKQPLACISRGHAMPAHVRLPRHWPPRRACRC